MHSTRYLKKLIVLILSVILLMMPVSCTSTPSYPPQRSGGLGPDPSWAYYYHSVSDMCTHSDVIAIGVADRIIESREEGTRMYMTYWDFRVEKILEGEEVRELTVVQMGSPDVPGSDIEADPLFLPRDRYLLFLKESSEGNYYFHPQGRFLIWENKVYSMNYILSDNAALRPVPGLNCNGDDLDTIEDKITEIVDSVQLIFTRYKARSPGDTMRYSAGMTVDIYANLSTGKNGPGKVTYKVNWEALPAGLEVSVRPAEFEAEPYTEYESILIIIIAPDVPPGTYYIPVEYDFEGVGSGSRTITLHINPINHDTVTNEDLIERGLKSLGESEE
jgi:hypothetical protein